MNVMNVTKNTYLGLFFVSLSVLMHQILLTRIFSVATWYYFAFFAISVAMFGFTVGALIVYLYKKHFTDDVLQSRLVLFSSLLGLSVGLSLLIFLSIPFHPRLTGMGIFSTLFVYLIISIPYICAGIVVCLCLTRFDKKVGLFYGADLVGAACGAFLVFPLLNAMDVVSAILVSGVAGAAGALFFVAGRKGEPIYRRTTVIFLICAGLMLFNFAFRPFTVEWVKMSFNKPEFETWNTISRIAVYPLKWVSKPYSWGLSGAYEEKRLIGERMIDIDGVSETVMTWYDGTPESVDHLRFDVTHIAHHIRDDAKVFVIGVGGGRDIVAAKKVFNQREVVGAEINRSTIQLLTEGPYAEFTGNIPTWDGVRLVNDEARSAITRMDEEFDIIQASCIATWSATSAGAFSLAENTLYTIEGWKTFYDHLSPTGIMAFNRWFFPDYPAQLLRMTSLAVHTLENEGVEDPSSHIAIVTNGMTGDKLRGYTMPSATIMVSKAPFSESDIARLNAVIEEYQFYYVYSPSPDGHRDKRFQEILDNAGDADFYNAQELDITPPTDDRPFFFYMLRLSDFFAGEKHLKFKEQRFSMEGIAMLYVLLIVSIVLSILFIFVPLALKRDGPKLPRSRALIGLMLFASIGFGYILIEIAMLQRLIIFLGHPIYSITVVLFSMLLASGIGAMFSNKYLKKPTVKHIAAFMTLLLALLLVVIFFQPGVLASYIAYSNPVRVGISLLFLMPIGFLMGLPFPLGMEYCVARYKEYTPWFWATNGATGVVSSVLSVCISIVWGFTATMTVGLFFYVLATIALLLLYSDSSTSSK